MIKQLLEETKILVLKNLKLMLVLGSVMLLGNILLETVDNILTDNNISGLAFVWGILKWLVQMYAGLVMIKIMFYLAEKKELKLDEVKRFLSLEKSEVKRYILTSLVVGFLVVAGLILLIVPGIIWGLMFSMAIYAAVDQELGVKAAMAMSKKITRGYKWKLFGLGWVVILINLVAIIPLGLGLVITIPATALLWVLTYNKLAEKPEASIPSMPEQNPPQPVEIQPKTTPLQAVIPHVENPQSQVYKPTRSTGTGFSDYQI